MGNINIEYKYSCYTCKFSKKLPTADAMFCIMNGEDVRDIPLQICIDYEMKKYPLPAKR